MAAHAVCGCAVTENQSALRGLCAKVRAVPENYFDERIAKGYETFWPESFEPGVVDPAVDFLAELAVPGAALELGIGTGRVALPLSQRSVRVHGIELSPALVGELRGKPDAAGVGVRIGALT